MGENEEISSSSGATHGDIKRVERSIEKMAKFVTDSFVARDGELKDIRDEAKKDRDAQNLNLTKTTDKIFRAIQHNEDENMRRHDRNSEGQKPQWRVLISLLALILGVITAVASVLTFVIAGVGSVLAWNMSRIEDDGKERLVHLDAVVQREMRLLDSEQKVGIDELHSRLIKVDEQLQRSDREFIDLQARTDERVKILWELRKEK